MTQSEPLSWKPRLLAFPSAIELYDFELMKEDLKFAKACFERISDRKYGVIFSAARHVDEDFNHWCAFVAGGIYYRRCFKSGVRTKIALDDVVHLFGESEMYLHEALIAIVDKHVAHSVNEMELGCSTLTVAIDSAGKLHRGGISYSGSGSGPFGPPAYKTIQAMIDRILEVVATKIEEKRAEVQEIVDRMPDEEITQLPEGFPPHIELPRYDKPRNWPRSKG